MEIPNSVLQKEQLPPLPFTYERTTDSLKAAYRERRVAGVRLVGEEYQIYSDEEILKRVAKDREGTDWFLSDYWREKGLPQEQVELRVGNQQITVYNFNRERPFTEEHLVRTKRALAELASHFPQAIQQLRWILLDDIPHPSAFGDPEKYPWNGNNLRGWRAFRLLPRGTELIPHRIQTTSNLEGTIVHELAHSIDRDFEKEWFEKGFVWDFCIDHKDEWEIRLTPDGREKKFYNKQTGEMAPHGVFPLQPDQCVNYYARGHIDEDICESMVAYIYDPELLKQVSPVKFTILQNHDAKMPKPIVKVQKIPQNHITLPAIKPEVVYYYIQEPVESTKF